MAGIFINNPIAWAQIKARGSWSRYMSISAVYFAVIGGLIYYSYEKSNANSTLTQWTNILLGIEMAIIYFFGCTMISTSVRKDITSGLIESHRLMPVSSLSALVGYIFGPGFTAICLFGATVLLGVATQGMSGNPIKDWLFPSAIAGALGLFLWCFVIFAAFISKNSFGIIFGVVTGMLSSQGLLVEYLPALNLLFSSVTGNNIYLILHRVPHWSGSTLAWSLLAQATFATIFLCAAMRKYRRDDRPAFSLPLAIALLLAWVVFSLIGFHFAGEISLQSIVYGRNRMPQNAVLKEFSNHLIGTIFSSLLLGMIAMYTTARAESDYQRTLDTTGVKPSHKPVALFIVALLTTGIVMVLFVDIKLLKTNFSTAPDIITRLTVVSGVVAATFFLAIGYLMWLMMKFDKKIFMVLAPYILILWIIPLLIQSVLDANRSDYAKLKIDTFSPIGLLFYIKEPDSEYPLSAIGAQIGITIAIIVLCKMIAHRKQNITPRPSAISGQ